MQRDWSGVRRGRKRGDLRANSARHHLASTALIAGLSAARTDGLATAGPGTVGASLLDRLAGDLALRLLVPAGDLAGTDALGPFQDTA